MRHVIYFLVVANLVFFLWHAIQGPTVGEPGLPALPANVKLLVTLEEREAALAVDVDAVTETQPPGAGETISCQMLGPFFSVVEIQSVEERLNQAGYRTEQYDFEENEVIGYWIYLPAMERDKAKEIGTMLDSKKDREYFIGKDNLISLGTFKELSRAEVRLAAVRKYGLDPTLEPRFRLAHWLNIEDPGGKDVDLALIEKEFPDVHMQQRVCD